MEDKALMDEQQWIELKAAVGHVSRETFLDLKSYEAMLRRWQARINLVAPSTLPELWRRHMIDSAQLVPLGGRGEKWLDVGSGGGFPGLVVAIFLKESGHGCVILVESNSKKAAFLRQVVAQLQLPATILCQRIEESYANVPEVDIITARALGPLPELLAWIAPYFTKKTTALLQKGQGRAQEIEQARHEWHFNLIEHQSRIHEQSTILEINGLQRKKG